MRTKLTLAAFVLFASCFAVYGQEQDDAAKEKLRRRIVIAESTIAEAREFRLPENRAVAFAKIAVRLWEIDQERAEALFSDAVSELLSAQAAAEATRKIGQQNELWMGQSSRPQVLQTIASRNAELALQSFYKTRPAGLERAIQNARSKDGKLRAGYVGADQQYAQSELQLEQSLIRMAADQNPAKAAALIKAAIRNGLTGETLNLLNKLFEKEPAAATDLAAEVVGRLSKSSFMTGSQPDFQTMQIAISFLSDFIRERPANRKYLQFDGSAMRGLAEKLVTFYLDRASQYGYGYGGSLVQIAEKLVPGAVDKLKQAEKNVPRRGLWGGCCGDPETQRIMSGEMSADQMLAELEKLPVESRGQVAQAAANKLAAGGEIGRARSILGEYFSGDALESAANSLDWTYAQQLSAAGRYQEAEALIDEMPEVNRVPSLVSLANSAFGRDPEKYRSYAIALLEKARGLLPAKPENNSDLSNLMQILAANTRIAPSESFRIFESIVPPINEVAEASVVVSSFQGGNIRQGEASVSQGYVVGIYLDTSVIKNLAENDLDRTLSLLNTFSRREMRYGAKQSLLDSF